MTGAEEPNHPLVSTDLGQIQIAKLMKEAGFKDTSACVEDVLYLSNRTLSKDHVARYTECG